MVLGGSLHWIFHAQSLDRTFGKISAKFCEYNPSNRVVG
nr:MAG TPA: hypothetical protein [Caudoviricetes sp.]